MKRGFYLIDGLLASCIILFSIQGTLLLAKKTKTMETANREKGTASMVLDQLCLAPVEDLEFSEREYDFSGDPVEGDGFFHVTLVLSSEHGFEHYEFTLSYRDRMGEEVEIHAGRWEVEHE